MIGVVMYLSDCFRKYGFTASGLLLICLLLLGCGDQAIVKEFSTIRFMDPYEDLDIWQWNDLNGQNQVSGNEPKKFMMVGLDNNWRRSAILSRDNDYLIEMEIGCDGVFEFATLGAVSTDIKHPESVGLTIQLTHADQVIKKDLTLPVTDTEKANWEDVRIPVDGMTGIVKCRFRMKKTADSDENLRIFIATPMFVPTSTQSKPDVVLWAFDALRADELGAYGSPHGNTPTLDMLSKKGTLFTEAISSANWTVPGVKNMMAGLITHKYIKEYQPFEDIKEFSVPLIQNEFAKEGYTTIGISSNHLICPGNGLAKGFDIFDVGASENWLKGSGTDLYRTIERILNQYADRPVFVYIHAMDPHDPYSPFGPFKLSCDLPDKKLVHQSLYGGYAGKWNKEPCRSRRPLKPVEKTYLRRLYQGEIRQMDSCFLVFLSLLKRLELFDNIILAVTADHGEEFAEHEYYQHGMSLYEAVVRVPLVFYNNSGIAENMLRFGRVSTMDVPQTLLPLAGVDPNPLFQSVNLFNPLMVNSLDRWMFTIGRSNDDPAIPAYMHRCLYVKDRKLVWNTGPVLKAINLKYQPDESDCVVFSSWEDFYSSKLDKSWQSMGLKLQEFLEITDTGNAEGGTNPQWKAQLRELGYID